MSEPDPKKIKRPEGWKQYDRQKRSAKRRGIPFLFMFEEWWAWWQTDGRWANRGRCTGQFVMARKGDTGPYSPENVYCATHNQNTLDIPSSIRKAAGLKSAATIRMIYPRRASPSHLKAGASHPRSKAVTTPAGRFGSIRLAAEHHGLSAGTASWLVQQQRRGWRYASDDTALARPAGDQR